MAVQPAANFSSVINVGLPASVPDSFKQPESKSIYQLLVQTAQNLLTSLETYCGISQKAMTVWSLLSPSDTLLRQNLGRLYVQSTEDIAFGALVNLFDNGGSLGARNANSSTGRRAHAYCSVNSSAQTGIPSGLFGEVILTLGLIGISGVNPGDNLWLASVNGQMQTTPDTTAGHIEQYIGVGVAPNLVYVCMATGAYIQH